MAATTMMRIRFDEDLEAKAAQTLDELGWSVSDAVRIFLKRVVVEESLPLPLKVPNDRTRAAIAEADATLKARFSSAEDLIEAVEEDVRTEKGRPSAQE